MTWTPKGTLIRSSVHVALAVTVLRQWRVFVEIFAIDKWSNSGSRARMLRTQGRAWGLWPICVMAIEGAHAS